MSTAIGKNGLCVVITTIQQPTGAISALTTRLVGENSGLIIIGDKKGPRSYDLAGTEFFSIKRQLALRFDLARALPVGHYARKNIGYLEGIARGAACIYETDDDNAPLADWAPRSEHVDVREIDQRGWVNVYRCFSNEHIWPRGLPLDALGGSCSAAPVVREVTRTVRGPIQQGLANGSPDVDAIWRLVLDRPFEFDDGPSVFLPPGSWCPFNSQSTWWWPQAYPLMYLPSHCSFRMTDIWRSFVAQRCLWELGYGVVFHGPEVVQERNEHDLMRDFADEVSGYLRNKELARILSDLNLKPGAGSQGENLLLCYEALVSRQFFAEEEIRLVQTWLDDLAHIENSDGRTVA
jgi:hypothetical protein